MLNGRNKLLAIWITLCFKSCISSGILTVTHSGWTYLRTLTRVVSGLLQDGTVKLYLLCKLVVSLIKSGLILYNSNSTKVILKVLYSWYSGKVAQVIFKENS